MPTIRVNDIAVYYEQAGAGEPLVLIGGLATDVSECGKLIELLAEHYRVLAFDNRGAGRTDKPHAPYSMPQMADDTAALMRALGITQAHVVGISMGGRIALELGFRHAGLVKSLILASTSARVRHRRSTRLLGLLSAAPLLRGRYPQPRYAFQRQRDAGVKYDASAKLSELHLPTAVMHGRRDRAVPYRLAQALCAGIPGATLFSFSGGHRFTLFGREQSAFVARVVEFTDAL